VEQIHYHFRLARASFGPVEVARRVARASSPGSDGPWRPVVARLCGPGSDQGN